MHEREIDRRRERGRAPAAAPHPAPHPVLALQRAAGNHAVARALAGVVTSNKIHIPGVGDIAVTGGNLEQWTAAETPQTVDVTSHKGRHSAALEKLAHQRAPVAVKVSIAPPNTGAQLTVGGWVLDIKDAEVQHYAVAEGTETWRLGGNMNVHRTKTSHGIG
jgi:hypothetical protein